MSHQLKSRDWNITDRFHWIETKVFMSVIQKLVMSRQSLVKLICSLKMKNCGKSIFGQRSRQCLTTTKIHLPTEISIGMRGCRVGGLRDFDFYKLIKHIFIA